MKTGVDEEELIRRMRTLPIKKVQFNPGGSSMTFRLLLSDGSSAAFKPLQVHAHSIPRREIAAYRLNRTLGLARVPPATSRIVQVKTLESKLIGSHRKWLGRIRKEGFVWKGTRLSGEVSWWVPNLKFLPIAQWKMRKQWYRWLKAGGELPDKRRELASQISTMIVFDYLIYNMDRFSGGNTMSDPSGRFLYFMDNTHSFLKYPHGNNAPRKYFHRVERFSKRTYRALKQLTAEGFTAEIRKEKEAPWPILKKAEIDEVIRRKDRALARIEGLIRKIGRGETLVFR